MQGSHLRGIVRRLEDLSDAETLELHRIVSKAAAMARLRDPEYVARQKMGYEAARPKMHWYRQKLAERRA